jgi:hypothetical protein
MQHELALFEGATQLVEQRQAAADRVGERRLPGFGIVRATRLRLLQRDIEIAQDIVLAAVRSTGDDVPDIRGQTDSQFANDDRRRDKFQQTLGKCLGIGRRGRGVAEDDPEFVGSGRDYRIARPGSSAT